MTDTVLVALVGSGSAILASILAWIGGRRDARLKHEADTDTQIDARWQAMLDQQREGFNAQLAPMRDDIADLRSRVEGLTEDVHKRDGIIATLAAYVREILTEWRAHHPLMEPPAPPGSISHLI